MISSSNRLAGPFTGNSVTTAFNFAFKVFQQTDPLVVQTDNNGNTTDLVYGSAYTVSLNSNQDISPGGTITLMSALPTGYTLYITSQLAALQAANLTNTGNFYPQVIDNALDYLTILIQQMLLQLNNSLGLPETTTGVNTTLPTPVAGSLFGWNVSGNGLANYPTIPTTFPAPSPGAVLGWGAGNTVVNYSGLASTLISSAMTPVVQAATVGAANALLLGGASYGFRNKIINGDMVIDQANGGASVTNTAGSAYSVDMWKIGGSVAGKFSAQQSAGAASVPPGFNSYVGITSLSAYTPGSSDYFYLEHDIEGYLVADLQYGTANAASVSLQFMVCSSATGTFSGTLVNGTGAYVYAFNYTITAANTWTPVQVTIPGDTAHTLGVGNAVGLRVRFGLGSGASYQGAAGSWQIGFLYGTPGSANLVATNGATLAFTGVQLERGTQTPFEIPPPSHRLAACQRYYETSYSVGVAPGTATGVGAVGSYVQASSSIFVNVAVMVTYKVSKRATPTVTPYSSTTGASGKLRDGGNGADVTATITNSGVAGCIISAPITTSVSANPVLQYVADARM